MSHRSHGALVCEANLLLQNTRVRSSLSSEATRRRQLAVLQHAALGKLISPALLPRSIRPQAPMSHVRRGMER
jgi:hypothetical protein